MPPSAIDEMLCASATVTHCAPLRAFEKALWGGRIEKVSILFSVAPRE